MCRIVVDRILANPETLFVAGRIDPAGGGRCTSVKVTITDRNGAHPVFTTVSVLSNLTWDVTLNLANYPELGERQNPCSGAPLSMDVTCADNSACTWSKKPTDDIVPRCCPTLAFVGSSELPCTVVGDTLMRQVTLTWTVVRATRSGDISLGYLGPIATTIRLRDPLTGEGQDFRKTYDDRNDTTIDSHTFVVPGGASYDWALDVDAMAGCVKLTPTGTIAVSACDCAAEPSIKGKLRFFAPDGTEVTEKIYAGTCIDAASVTVKLPDDLYSLGLPTRWSAPAVTTPADATTANEATLALPAAAAGAEPTATDVTVRVGYKPCAHDLKVSVKRCAPAVPPTTTTRTTTTTTTPPPALCAGIDCVSTLVAWKGLLLVFLVTAYLGINFYFEYKLRSVFNEKIGEVVTVASQTASKAATAASQAGGTSGAAAYGVGVIATEIAAQVATAVSETLGTTATALGQYTTVISWIQKGFSTFGIVMIVLAIVSFVFGLYFFIVWLTCCSGQRPCRVLANIAWTTAWGVILVGFAALGVAAVHLFFEIDRTSSVLSPPIVAVLIFVFALFESVLVIISGLFAWLASMMGCRPLPPNAWPWEGGDL